MNPSDPENPAPEETRLAESDVPLHTRRRASGTTLPGGDGASQHARSKFAVILNELDLRSRKSNQWLTALSVIYVAVVLLLVAVLYLRYSEVEDQVEALEKDLAETKEAIAEQASIHRQQSQDFSGRIDESGAILDGMTKDREALETLLDEGKAQADALLQESDALRVKITKIDGIIDDLTKRAEPFQFHYATDPEKPQNFGRGRGLDVLFEIPKSESPPADPDDTILNGKFRIPAGGTYMVTGWFSTGKLGDPPSVGHIVETEIRVNGIPYWSGISSGNGTFTSGLPLQRGQLISIHATITSSDEESDPPSGAIEQGEIRISRLYYAPE